MIPQSLEAEEAVIGCMLLSRDATAIAQEILSGGDFMGPENAALFDAIKTLWDAGASTDAVSVAEEVKRNGHNVNGLGSRITSLLSAAPASSAIQSVATIVARSSLGRRVWETAHQTQERLENPENDPVEVLETLQENLKNIDIPALHVESDDTTFDELRGRPAIARKPWVIPGLLRQDWRAIIVGREGEGKSMLLQQIAVCASYGDHPFTHKEMTPAKVLLIDLENPDDEIQERIERIASVCERTGAASGGGRLWHRPGGIDLRKRIDRTELEEVLRKRRPNLVVMGPLYKAYSRSAAENDEQVASEVQHTLDDLRTRYEFALCLETHAPKGDDPTHNRPLAPFGSSLWLRWSELGFQLRPEDWRKFPSPTCFLGRFRGDRVKNTWPDKLNWGTMYPWEGTWVDGYDKEVVR